MISPLIFIKAWLILIQNNKYRWWIEINKGPEYNFHDNIGDMPVRSYWYYSNDTKRNPWVNIIAVTPRRTLGLCYVHIAQLMTYPAIYTLPFTLQLSCKPLGILQRATKSRKVHISIHDRLQRLYNINLALHRSQGFQGWEWNSRNLLFSPLNTKFFKQWVYLSLTYNHY